MKYILDTNICIYIIKRKPSIVFDKFKHYVPGDIGISSITLAELHYGIKKSTQPEKNRHALNQFILPLEIFDFDFQSATEYGKIRSELEKKGEPIGPLDTLIAAQVIVNGYTLVTNNEKEFNRIEGLRIENWTK